MSRLQPEPFSDIKLCEHTQAGHAKILDFGLASIVETGLNIAFTHSAAQGAGGDLPEQRSVFFCPFEFYFLDKAITLAVTA